MNVYDFKVKNMKEESISLSEYKGKVLLIINSATKCGFTPQYEDLQKLYEELGDKEFEILDFPSNQFENQAPGTNEEIASFCSMNFGVKFPMFSKIEVNGEDADPLFKYLKSQKGFASFDPLHPITAILESKLQETNPNYKNESDIKWNFTKFLIDKNGDVVERFEPTTNMNLVSQKVKKLL